MDEDIVIIDEDGQQRNAVIVDRRGGRPGPTNMFGNRPWGNRPWPAPGGRPYYPAPPVYNPPPVYHPPVAPTVYQPAPAPTVTTVTTTPTTTAASMKSWIPDIIDILAAVSPLPAPPTATGDLAKDFANAMTYAGALGASFKRADLLHTAARVIEKRL